MFGVLLLCAFLLGAVPFAFLIGKARGVDIRTVGSGNVGATNLARACGFWLAAIALAADSGKGAVPVLCAGRFFPDLPWLPAIAGCCSVAGHCYSPFLRFRGGKGVATALGVLAVLDPMLILILLTLWGLALLTLKNVGVASSLAALGGLAAGVERAVSDPHMLAFSEAKDYTPPLLVVVALLILFRHRKNLVDFFCRGRARETGS